MIEVQHLTKRYGPVRAVRDISFEVERGALVGFLGPNGAGKSTTLRILSGFLGATSGRVRIDGHDVVDERFAALEKLGYMPETCPLYPEMRVGEYLRFRSELKGVARRERSKEVGRVLERAKVRDMEDVLIAHLSKGYRQRVGLADALLGSPPLLILDEPTAGLDPNQIRDVRDLIRDLGSDHTVLLSSHILSEVEATCERAIVIHRGELVATGSIEELRRGVAPDGLELVVADDAEDALELLRGRDEVERAEADPRDDEGLVRIAITMRTDEQDLGAVTEALIFALAEAKIPMRRVAPVSATLEDVFSRVTEDAKGSKKR